MAKKIAAIVFIYLCTCLAWVILGTSMSLRSNSEDSKLKGEVGELWGTTQHQKAPVFYTQTLTEKKVETAKGGETVTEYQSETSRQLYPPDASDIQVDIKLEPRQKGLLWYSTYRVGYDGKYRVANDSNQPREISLDFAFPTKGAVYDNFHFLIGGKEIQNIQLASGNVSGSIKLNPGESQNIEISYQSQGLDEWWYDFGKDVNQVKNFSLVMQTNFNQIDFPENSISPTEKQKSEDGWQLKWKYSNLLSGVQLGMIMPKKLNPGPWVSKVSFSAPISLFLFFFILFIFTIIRKIKIHPMNYFFIGASFFSFHLLLSYLVDHISIHWAFLVCSLVSIFLVVSYMRMVVDKRFAYVEVGLSQFVYLVLFSYTYFFEGYTGLAITILCIVTLYIVMQYTGKLDWEKVFQKNDKPV